MNISESKQKELCILWLLKIDFIYSIKFNILNVQTFLLISQSIKNNQYTVKNKFHKHNISKMFKPIHATCIQFCALLFELAARA